MMLKELHIDINKAMSICLRNGVKVQAVVVGKRFAIEVVLKDSEKKRYNSLVDGKEVAAAVRKTYIAYSKLILKEQQDANITKS